MARRIEKRPYTLRKRAAQQEETRARIVAATMALHEEVGPRNTTVSAVAERASVQRLTVYRYFPDEMSLFQACTSSWLELNPPPPLPQPPRGTAAPDLARDALAALYRYYRGARGMLVVSYRDLDVVPALQSPMQNVAAYLQAYAQALVDCLRPARAARKHLLAATTLAVQFATWRTLDDSGLDDAAMAELMQASWQGIAAGRS